MEIFQIVGLALVATILSVLLKGQKPELAIQLSIVTGAIIFIFMISRVSAVLVLLQDVANRVSLDLVYLTSVLKIIGIAYISTFGAEICRDAGESAIASKVEFAGKILIMILAIPILMAVLEIIIKIMP
ncbi:stage III sporulation protein AC/AD protein family protein [Oxobacter pfennigii]|uniref:Stage III sporulation protein AC/AD protein family protein n=1 Tax=Oxobacter pfennigii TaxID=36849 RepID=A0A0N8NTI4_9CLOT|nr:stage III sporulation protein AD [Oxobacter pfennigii]KPU44920.1 stage III sporulation protein AC/AD protein family protein [Oxobacter pfennigii]